jgi:hypothetical protein
MSYMIQDGLTRCFLLLKLSPECTAGLIVEAKAFHECTITLVAKAGYLDTRELTDP